LTRVPPGSQSRTVKNMTATRRALTMVLIVITAACTRTPATATSPSSSAPDPLSSVAPAVTGLAVTVTESAYGTLALQTANGAECSAELSAVAPSFGEAPPSALPAQVATTSGVVRWTYPAPRLPVATAYYRVSCHAGSASGSADGQFSVSRGPMVASALTVRLSTDSPPRESFAQVGSLVALRDAAVARMRSTLSAEWKSATRGLGGLQVVEQSADITIFVLAAHGISVHRRAGDGSEDILVYVEGELGQKTVENTIATTLHELGHIWCCEGPEADGGGHWKTKERDPGLYGVDKYGLMTDPVTCVAFGAVLSCPNRFSDREMRALGFTSFPPPVPDPCITQAFSLSSQLTTTKSQLATLDGQITTANAQLAGIDAQLSAIRAQYPNGAPPAVVNQANALVAQYNALNTQNNARIDEYNALAARSRSLATQLNALPCDVS
jgi:hypothetical protein